MFRTNFSDTALITWMSQSEKLQIINLSAFLFINYIVVLRSFVA